jgi:DNA-binding transcriptional MocR family regulator
LLPVRPAGKNGLPIEVLKKLRADAVYVTPSHQFPIGMVMPVSGRLQLLNWAKVAGSRTVPGCLITGRKSICWNTRRC